MIVAISCYDHGNDGNGGNNGWWVYWFRLQIASTLVVHKVCTCNITEKKRVHLHPPSTSCVLSCGVSSLSRVTCDMIYFSSASFVVVVCSRSFVPFPILPFVVPSGKNPPDSACSGRPVVFVSAMTVEAYVSRLWDITDILAAAIDAPRWLRQKQFR